MEVWNRTTSVDGQRETVSAENCLSAEQHGPWKKVIVPADFTYRLREIFRAAWLVGSWLSVNLIGLYRKGFSSLGQITDFIQKPLTFNPTRVQWLILRTSIYAHLSQQGRSGFCSQLQNTKLFLSDPFWTSNAFWKIPTPQLPIVSPLLSSTLEQF